MRPHVDADRGDVGRLLDVLLAPATRVDSIDEAIEAAIANPTAVIVTGRGRPLRRVGVAGRRRRGRWRHGRGDRGSGAAQGRRRFGRGECRTDVERFTSDLASAERREADVAARLDANDTRFNASSEGLAAGTSGAP